MLTRFPSPPFFSKMLKHFSCFRIAPLSTAEFIHRHILLCIYHIKKCSTKILYIYLYIYH